MKTSFSLPRRLAAGSLGMVLAGSLAFAGVAPANAAAAAAVSTAQVTVAAAKQATEVKTTSNLNMRASSNTSSRIILTIPKNKTVKVKSQAKNGWYQVTYSNKTGWVSNKYVSVVKTAAPAAPKKPAAPKAPASSAPKSVKLWVTPKSNLNIRKGSGTNHAVVGKISKGQPAYATSRASNGWYKITTKGKTGWVSGQYVTTCSKGCEIDSGNYTTNRAGLNDRYFTKSAGADLYASVNGKRNIGDIPKNSIVYRDLASEKKAGQVSGWYYVRTQGSAGWMKVSQLKRSTDARTTNSSKISRQTARKQANGKMPESMLVALSWDKEKTLIAAPAAADLGRLNTAFKKKFGKNLDIDLAYRTLETQKLFYKELGPYIAAKPGTSNHGWGLAIDVPETYDYSFKGKYYKWLKTNAKKYNWNHRTDLEEFRANGTRNPYAEAWHFEYIGK